MEVYDVLTDKWVIKTGKFNEYVLNMGMFTCSQPTLDIKSGIVNT